MAGNAVPKQNGSHVLGVGDFFLGLRVLTDCSRQTAQSSDGQTQNGSAQTHVASGVKKPLTTRPSAQGCTCPMTRTNYCKAAARGDSSGNFLSGKPSGFVRLSFLSVQGRTWSERNGTSRALMQKSPIDKTALPRAFSRQHPAEQPHLEERAVAPSTSFLGASFWMLTPPLKYAPSSMEMRWVAMSPVTTADCFRSTRSLA